MKRQVRSAEELSILYDKIATENHKEDFANFTEHEMDEFRQIEKTVELLNRVGQLEINDKELFVQNTIKRCNRKGKIFIPAFTLKKYIAPTAAAAAVAVALFTFGVFKSPDTGVTERERIAAGINRNEEYLIVAEYEKNLNTLEKVVLENGGEILESKNGVLTVQAKLSEYNSIKKEMTLSEEEKVFLKNEKKLVSAGTDSEISDKKYEDKVITFSVTTKK